MNFKTSVIAVLLAAALVLVVSVRPVGAQSLAEIARKEQERRKTAPAAKVYTNKDLPDIPASAAGVPAPAATAPDASSSSTGNTGDAAAQATPAAAGDTGAAAQPAADASKEPAKDRDYWAGRMKDLLTTRDRDQMFAQAMQVQVDALATDFVNRDDPSQRVVIANNRQKAIDELARLRRAIDDDNKAIAAFEEEARRASVPPGWLR